MQPITTSNLKQYLLLSAIFLLIVVLSRELFQFIPGVLGAATLYIILRQWYFKLTVIHNWKKWLTAVVFILGSIIVIVLPFFLIIQALAPKISYIIGNTNQFTEGVNTVTARIRQSYPNFNFNTDQVKGLVQKVTNSLPTVLGAAGNVFTNLILTFFLLYFMLVDGRKMERQIHSFLPLKDENLDNMWDATRTMVISNAIGIPVLAAIQGAVAMLGYWIFGIDQYVLWGVITGIFSVIPVVGTAIIWIPLTIYLFASGHSSSGIGLLVYSVVVITNIDNVARFTLLKKLGDVHPIITVFGIIVGVPLFGFMGFIFGPLLISYLLLLIKIYRIEFSRVD